LTLKTRPRRRVVETEPVFGSAEASDSWQLRSGDVWDGPGRRVRKISDERPEPGDLGLGEDVSVTAEEVALEYSYTPRPTGVAEPAKWLGTMPVVASSAKV
jgi:hypothetical protein